MTSLASSRPRSAVLAVLAALALALTLLSTAPPARAHAAKGNWADFHTICSGCTVNEGNLIRFWQTILMAHFHGNYYNMNCSFVDGSFGANTRDWTKKAQRQLGVDDDGVVGPKTWSAVRSRLTLVSSGSTSNEYTYYNSANPVYGAGKRMALSYNHSTGYWRFSDYCGSGSYVYLNHS